MAEDNFINCQANKFNLEVIIPNNIHIMYHICWVNVTYDIALDVK